MRSLNAPYCTGPCDQGDRPCTCATGRVRTPAPRPRAIPTRPGLREHLARLRARLQRWLLRRELQSRLVSLEHLQDDLRRDIEELRSAAHLAASPAVAEAAVARLRQCGGWLDEARAQSLITRQRLAQLEAQP